MKYLTDWTDEYIDACANVLMGIAVVGSAFYFWPVQQSQIWQMFNFSNTAVFIWAAVMVAMIAKNKEKLILSMPDICVWGYLVVSLLSIAFARDIGRSIGFNIKLMTMMVAGYSLICFSAKSITSVRKIYHCVTVAAVISIIAASVTKFFLPAGTLGFHGNIFKYAAYISPLAVICGTYWFGADGVIKKVFAGLIVASAVLSASTAGAAAAIIAGMGVAFFVTKNTSARLWIIIFVGLAVILLFLIPAQSDKLSIANDFSLLEADGRNIRQRYIEWQAELNMLEKRAGTGTGAGAVNDYRSEFYYRLVKANTLKAFDFNGWLVCAAETGVIGLLCLGWIFYSYAKKSSRTIAKGDNQVRRFARANLAALMACAAANVFGVLMYNGVIIVFVLILAMTASAEKLSRQENEY